MNYLEKINHVIDLVPNETESDTLTISNDIYVKMYNKINYGYYRGYRVYLNLDYAKDTIVFIKPPNMFFNKDEALKIYECYENF